MYERSASQSHLIQSLLYSKVLTISVQLEVGRKQKIQYLNTAGNAVESPVGHEWFSLLRAWLTGDSSPLLPELRESIMWHPTRLGKDRDSKLYVQLLLTVNDSPTNPICSHATSLVLAEE